MTGIKINLELKNSIPNMDTLFAALLIALVASIVFFLINFFGLKTFFDFIPDGFEIFAIVFASVYIRKLIVVKFRGREII